MTIFTGISATDGDKPNTPNSEIHYSITSGNQNNKFSLDSAYKPNLVLKKSLDYDTDDQEFNLLLTATVSRLYASDFHLKKMLISGSRYTHFD